MKVEYTVECLIIGGGPAGLTAATYLGRFRRRAVLVDAGHSRAARIPITHNLIAFSEGIGGPDLLARMRAQSDKYGVRREVGSIEALSRRLDGRFDALGDNLKITSDLILLASGALDVEPDLTGIREAVRTGLVRYCPICDAFEARGQAVALISYGKCRVKEALLLRGYTSDLTVLTLGREMHLAAEEERVLTEAGIAVLREPVVKFSREREKVAVWPKNAKAPLLFDTLYSALGSNIHSDLAVGLGADSDEDGALIVDRHQMTSVDALYAAGDVVQGLSQVSVAAAHAAIAATAMNARLDPLRF